MILYDKILEIKPYFIKSFYKKGNKAIYYISLNLLNNWKSKTK